MLQQQLARLDVINQLQLYNDLRFSYSMEDNYSIERLYIEGVERLYSDPLAIIPHLKALTTLCIFDVTTINILKVFRRRNITNLKLKRLSLQVCKIPIRELGEIFDLREIVYFELVFFKNVRPYSDLKWLASNMPKLRDIKIVWWNASFEKIMEQLAGHRIVNVRLHSLQPKKEGDIQRCESTMPNLIKGHERSLTHFSLYSGMEEITGIWDRHKWYTRKDPSDNSKVNTHIKIFSRRKFFLKMDAYGQQQIVIAG
ncbi:uncharacterized protein SPAPADRAFT_62396 [Spathaspora passalidarum NRRL Y-27907]|uniref:F-box domain-containing protein n=1 Tax=Spathaspora passalidarum (strain NRRL Y-27907 / 11-Y1) TaxID=619300 RepID=G3ARQ0_SPAPN|nr:uncharacterized protein SPAPADRAFT_62396 [Spathaspora passalidarum NRRL Y-27907]EGW31803.1 hypothetical protein SPAPADRAFT_62396 [Spathaspora passalidarum NRRL Y-27907]